MIALRTVLFSVAFLAAPVLAQQAQPFSSFQQSPEAPIEISSDRLGISQESQTAVFIGNVQVVQGELTLIADRMTVTYAEAGDVDRLLAEGNVLLTSGLEAAEAQRAEYNIADGLLILEGDALLTQGQNALSSETMRINVADGSGEFVGRVRSVFVPVQE